MKRVLLLAPEGSFGNMLSENLRRFGIDHVERSRSPLNLRWRWTEMLDTDIIVVDANFCGNGRETARLVRKIRREFGNPMIVFEAYATNEGAFACQVAGCNFFASGDTEQELRLNICQQAGLIFQELSRDHQKAA